MGLSLDDTASLLKQPGSTLHTPAEYLRMALEDLSPTLTPATAWCCPAK
jgi:hypothetical protein